MTRIALISTFAGFSFVEVLRFEVASLRGFKVISGNYSPQLNIFHLMTLRPYRSARSDACLSKNLITQQVEHLRNLKTLIIL